MRNLIGIFAAISLIACAEPTAPELEYGNGRINLRISSLSTIVFTNNAFAGRPFDLQVVTWGGGCTELDRTTVRATDRGAIVLPYDRLTAEPACTKILRSIRHNATLTFSTPGEKVITVRAHDFETGEPTVAEITITVRP